MKVKLDTFDLDDDQLRSINYLTAGSSRPASRNDARAFLEAAAWAAVDRALVVGAGWSGSIDPAEELEEPEGGPRSPAGGSLDDLEEMMRPYFGGHPDDDPPWEGGDEWHLYLSWAEARDITPEEMAAMMEARDSRARLVPPEGRGLARALVMGDEPSGFEALDRIFEHVAGEP